MKKILTCVVWLMASVAQADYVARDGFQWEAFRSLAIQERGRVKPFDTFALDSLLTITGRRTWAGRGATEIVFAWLVTYEKDWDNTPFIKVDHGPLKQQLGLDASQKYFSPREIRTNDKLRAFLRDIQFKSQRKERLSEVEKKAQHLQEQQSLLEAIVSGEIVSILPHPSDAQAAWVPLSALAQQTPLPYDGEKSKKVADLIRALINAFAENQAKAWNEALVPFVQMVRTDLGGAHYPTARALSLELSYNDWRPFRLAWMGYALAFVLCLVAIVVAKPWSRILALASVIGAILVHSWGFLARCLISGRPPVTNMYESVIWVTWGCVLFGLIIWWRYRNLAIIAGANAFAVVGLVLADNLPFALDPSIHPLEPVLRSNFWLTIHVLTITLSYAAFALSLCLGNIVMGNYLWRPKRAEMIQTYSLYMYRAVQIGVVLLAAGTILGGVWADYSWGRFWGWDPKEVWALIALLLYLAVLHGRFSGWLKGFGFCATTIVSFLGVLMAWYGVNFVLGVGLHSYGFGTGGIQWVLAYVILQIGFIVAAYWRYRASREPGQREAPVFPRS